MICTFVAMNILFINDTLFVVTRIFESSPTCDAFPIGMPYTRSGRPSNWSSADVCVVVAVFALFQGISHRFLGPSKKNEDGCDITRDDNLGNDTISMNNLRLIMSTIVLICITWSSHREILELVVAFPSGTIQVPTRSSCGVHYNTLIDMTFAVDVPMTCVVFATVLLVTVLFFVQLRSFVKEYRYKAPYAIELSAIELATMTAFAEHTIMVEAPFAVELPASDGTESHLTYHPPIASIV